MAKRLDQILVVDVESTCWEGEPPPGQESEIVEIGICPIDVASHSLLEKTSILVRPERSTVSQFCTALTSLTQAQVDSGISFPEACSILRKRCLSRERTWCSYGDYDRLQFERQCRSWNITYPFGPTHLNVKNLFALIHGLPREVGMDKALALSSLALEGTHHRAADDAWNIARILLEIMRGFRRR